VPCRHLLVGGWTTGAPFLGPLGRGGALRGLLRDCVVGWGLPQVTELFLRLTPGDVLVKAGVGASRLAASLRLATGVRGRRLWLGPEPERNADLVAGWLAQAPETAGV
jgi:hypothetical protein